MTSQTNHARNRGKFPHRGDRHFLDFLPYSLFLSLAFFVLFPYFAYQALVRRKYLGGLRERLGYLPEVLISDGRPTIWIHAVSVGEALAARPLIAALRARLKQHRIIISTTTATGQAVARALIAEADGFCYFPFDWRFSVRRALNTIRPQVVILMESELWPNYLRTCREHAIPVIVANGRISDRSFRRSRKFEFLMQHLYRQVSHFAMQSEIDAERALSLGAPADRVSICGNIKYDIGESIFPPLLTETLSQTLSLSQAPLFIAGSTSAGEEELIIRAIEEVRKISGLERIRLLIAPRHPERFDEVARLLSASRLSYIRRTSLDEKAEMNTNREISDAILLDSIGELRWLYQFASVVFIGGSLVPKGGHNILEPAFYGRPIIVGPHMENFQEITREFLAREAIIQLRSASNIGLIAELQRELTRLLTAPERAQRLGENARIAVEANRGATERYVEVITNLLPS